MAGLGRKVFTAGAVLAAADVDNYLMDQTVMKYANTSAVSSAVGTALAEGMTFYLSDTDEQVMYDGTRFIKQSAGQNAIANGDFSKWSRGTSIAYNNESKPSADKWSCVFSNAGTISQQAFTVGAAPVAGYESAYFLRFNRTTSTFNDFLTQRLEDVRNFAGQTITYSFWAKVGSGTLSTTPYVSQNFGSGGSAGVDTAGTTFTITTSWQRFVATVSVPSISGKTLGTGHYFSLVFPFLTAAGNITVDIWGVQLEAGSAATPFKPAGGNSALDTATAGSAGFDGVLVSTNSSSNPSGSGTPAWAGYDVAGKNKVINGGFDFWQRGTSFAQTSGVIYNADRWGTFRASFTAGSTTSRQATGLTGYQYAARVQRDSGNTSTAVIHLVQMLETVASLPFAGQTVTVSFYARKGANYTDTAGNLGIDLTSGTGTDQNLWGGFTGLTKPISGTAILTTSWQRFSFTGNVPANSTQLGLDFGYTPVGTAGAADYFEVTGVQLEAGSVATPFSRAGGTLQGELAACQRYYQVIPIAAGQWSGNTTSGSTYYYSYKFGVTMRAAPTCAVAIYGGSGFSSVSVNSSNVESVIAQAAATSTASGSYYSFNGTASAEL